MAWDWLIRPVKAALIDDLVDDVCNVVVTYLILPLNIEMKNCSAYFENGTNVGLLTRIDIISNIYSNSPNLRLSVSVKGLVYDKELYFRIGTTNVPNNFGFDLPLINASFQLPR